MQVRSLSRVKKKTRLTKLREDLIIHKTQTIVLREDDVDNTMEFIFNIIIKDIMENMEANLPNCYIEVMEFLNLEGDFL